MKLLGALALIIVAAFGAFILYGSRPRFADADIESIKQQIKSEFEKRDGISVKEVNIFRETDAKAVGFVKISINALGDVTKACSATMDQEGKRYMWRCE